jgi:hypothetical protein
VLVSFWGTWMSTRLLWQMSDTYIPVTCLHSFMSSLMISLRQWFAMRTMNGLFEKNCELYVEDEFDAANVLIYKPHPLHKVWLDETGGCQIKENLLRQHCRNEDLMHARRQETCERAGPTPCLPTPVMDDVLNGAAISDDDSVDSSVYSQHSEPEGEFRDDDDGFVHIPQPFPAPNIVNEGAGPNIIPEGDDPVNARKNRGRACQYSPAKWICGADGKMERVNLSELKQQKAMGKLNRDIFALTFGTRQIPPYAQIMSKKKKRIKYKQYQRSLNPVEIRPFN